MYLLQKFSSGSLIIVIAFVQCQVLSVSVTVDDANALWSYTASDHGGPSDQPGWAGISSASPCNGCEAKVDPSQVFNQSWHDSSCDGCYASVSFKGVSGTVYAICPASIGTSYIAPAVSNYSFVLNGVNSGSRTFDRCDHFAYNFPVFSFENLDPNTVSLLTVYNWLPGTILLDYLVFDNGLSEVPGSSVSQAPSTSQGSSAALSRDLSTSSVSQRSSTQPFQGLSTPPFQGSSTSSVSPGSSTPPSRAPSTSPASSASKEPSPPLSQGSSPPLSRGSSTSQATISKTAFSTAAVVVPLVGILSALTVIVVLLWRRRRARTHPEQQEPQREREVIFARDPSVTEHSQPHIILSGGKRRLPQPPNLATRPESGPPPPYDANSSTMSMSEVPPTHTVPHPPSTI